MSEKLKEMSRNDLLKLVRTNMLADLSTFTEKDVLIKKEVVSTKHKEATLAAT